MVNVSLIFSTFFFIIVSDLSFTRRKRKYTNPFEIYFHLFIFFKRAFWLPHMFDFIQEMPLWWMLCSSTDLMLSWIFYFFPSILISNVSLTLLFYNKKFFYLSHFNIKNYPIYSKMSKIVLFYFCLWCTFSVLEFTFHIIHFNLFNIPFIEYYVKMIKAMLTDRILK